MGWLYDESIQTSKKDQMEIGKITKMIQVKTLREVGFTKKKISECVKLPERIVSKMLKQIDNCIEAKQYEK